MLQAAPQTINGPGSQHIEVSAHGRFEHAIKCGTLIPILSSAQTMVNIFLNDYPAHPLSDCA
jgi:hypothetical protein